MRRPEVIQREDRPFPTLSKPSVPRSVRICCRFLRFRCWLTTTKGGCCSCKTRTLGCGEHRVESSIRMSCRLMRQCVRHGKKPECLSISPTSSAYLQENILPVCIRMAISSPVSRRSLARVLSEGPLVGIMRRHPIRATSLQVRLIACRAIRTSR